MSKHGVSLTGSPGESAVPTLKVMRLQSSQLEAPAAGTLSTQFLFGSSLALPDSFGLINVGETFSAYLGALNVSKTLPVLRLTVSAQLQTPSHKVALQTNLETNPVDLAAGGGGVDAIVTQALEEPGQHILRVEVGYGVADGGTKTLRKFYRFNVASPLNIRELTMRSGDASCFVSIAVENVSGVGLSISSADFQPPNGLTAERIGRTTPTTTTRKGNAPGRLSGAELFDSCGRLEPGSSFRYLFLVKAESQDATLRGIACGDELGKAVFTWRKAMGETGRIASTPVICPETKPPGLLDAGESPASKARFMMGTGSKYVVHGSGLSVDVAAAAANRSAMALSKGMGAAPALDKVLPVTVEPVDPPSRMELEVPQEVQFLIVNHSGSRMNLQLQMRLTNMSGVVVCGNSFRNLGEVAPSGGSCLVSIRFLALAAGLMQVRGCCIVDVSTGKEIPQPPLFTVFVENVAGQ